MEGLSKWREGAIPIFVRFKETFDSHEYNGYLVYAVAGESHVDAFSSRDNIIFYDESLCHTYQLSAEECIACIAHELGHLLDKTPKLNNMPTEEREYNADNYACQLGLAEDLASALNKMCPEEELTKKRILRMKKNIQTKNKRNMIQTCSHLIQVPDPNIPNGYLFYCQLLPPNEPNDNYQRIATAYKKRHPQHSFPFNGECLWVRCNECEKCPLYKY